MADYVDINIVHPDVETWLQTLNSYAAEAVASAQNVADSLNNFYPSDYSPDVGFRDINTDVNLTPPSNRPSKPILNLPDRQEPVSPGISIPTILIDSAPEFNEASPSLNIPNVPNPLDISRPIKDFIVNTSFDYPVSPDTTLPDVPTLLSLDLPTLNTIDLPLFNLSFPTSESIRVPGVTFSFVEDLYSSPLLDKVKSELLRRLNGGTGLNPVVEQAIWDRGKDRESRASTLSERALLVDRSSQGFSRPPGAALAALEQVVQETQGKIIDLSRDIMIKQAELEQENLKNAIQQTIALEDILIRENLAINQRSFEVAKYTQDIYIELFKIEVSKYQMEVEAYKAFSESYRARVQAELAKIEIFKGELEAQKLKGDINEQNIRLYIAKLEGIKSNVEIYKALVSTVSEKLRAEGLKLETYKTDIDAYRTAVSAKSEEYKMYSEQIKGELAKVEVYDSKVKAFASRIQAYAANADVVTKKAQIESNIEELKVKKYSADIDAYIKSIQSDRLLFESAIDIYKGETQLYLADTSVNKAIAELELKQAENIIQQNKYTSDIAIENARIYLESIKSAYTALLEAKRAAGSINAQIASSALSAINVSAEVKGDASVSLSESYNHSL